MKPVIKVALEVADSYISYCKTNAKAEGWQPQDELIDVLTRLRAAICLAEDAGLSTHALIEQELKIKLYE